MVIASTHSSTNIIQNFVYTLSDSFAVHGCAQCNKMNSDFKTIRCGKRERERKKDRKRKRKRNKERENAMILPRISEQ